MKVWRWLQPAIVGMLCLLFLASGMVSRDAVARTAAAFVGGEAECGSLENGYGPYDYMNRDDREKRLPIVEQHHFTFEVEALTKGKSGAIALDLDYTLRAFPNHHRALHAMARYQLKTTRPANAAYRSADCYFDRAKRFRPRDAEVYMIHGWYLHQRGDLEAALAQYRMAEQLKPGRNPPRDFRIGLLLFDMKRYDEARQYAERVYARTYPDDELRDKLKSVNQWRR